MKPFVLFAINAIQQLYVQSIFMIIANNIANIVFPDCIILWVDQYLGLTFYFIDCIIMQ